MIYMMRSGTGEMFECDTPQAALAMVSERRLLPAMLSIWRAEEPLLQIQFEDLQRMVGHDPIDIDTVGHQVDLVLAALAAPLRDRGLMFIEDVAERSISTSGIPSGHPSVERTYGNPCARVTIRLMRAGHLTGDPVPVGPTEIRAMLGVDAGGWTMVHSHCDTVIHHPLSRPYREVTMFLSKPRSKFDIEEDDDGIPG